MMQILKTLHGDIKLPTFFPDGTLGVVRGVDSTDLKAAGVEGLVINAYHLLAGNVGVKAEEYGGMHKLMNWDRPIITDSGGFQVMSLVHKNPKLGKIKDDEIIFYSKGGAKVVLTPENSIQTQLKLGADILIALDDCTKPEMTDEQQVKSVEWTIAWAKRCKKEFKRLASQVQPGEAKPLLFGVVQGGNDKKLRKECAKELIKIGFDGYCYGGFPVFEGKFLCDILEYTASLLPDDKPKYAMGVGKPEDIVASFKMGYSMFDCVIPTREARHKKLYVFKEKLEKVNFLDDHWYSNISIGSTRYEQDAGPVSKYCDCLTCKTYSRAYLHHLFKVGDSLSVRLATIHNLRFYAQLMEALKTK